MGDVPLGFKIGMGIYFLFVIFCGVMALLQKLGVIN